MIPKRLLINLTIFLINIGPSLALKIPNNQGSPSQYLTNRIQESCFFTPVNDEEVTKIIGLFKTVLLVGMAHMQK